LFPTRQIFFCVILYLGDVSKDSHTIMQEGGFSVAVRYSMSNVIRMSVFNWQLTRDNRPTHTHDLIRKWPNSRTLLEKQMVTPHVLWISSQAYATQRYEESEPHTIFKI
jgi:hypothetical protein